MNTKTITLSQANEMINSGDFVTGYFVKLVVTLKGMGLNAEQAAAAAKEIMNEAIERL